jgi:phospholipid/cholesterol/gamma-HCH transport system substrate-binding protein
MERPNARGSNNFVVGLFVFVSMLVGAGFIVFMGGSTSIGGEVRYSTFFADVRGLNVGAPVFLSGIQIGRVSGFEFPTDDIKKEANAETGIVTVVSIYKEHRHRIKKDSEASITTQGVLGDKVLLITPGTPNGPELDPQFLMASATAKGLDDYFSKGGNLVDNLNAVTLQLNELLKQMNEQGKVANILSNLDKATRSLEKTSSALNDPKNTLGGMIAGGEADEVGKAMRSLRRILEKVDKGQGTLGALVNDSTLHEDMKILLGGAKRSQAVRFLLRQAVSANDEANPDKPTKGR